jgi:hypothetical protein
MRFLMPQQIPEVAAAVDLEEVDSDLMVDLEL